MSEKKVKYFQVAQSVWGLKLAFVNVYIVANRKSFSKGWLLVDAGPKGQAKKIIAFAESIFGQGAKPSGIILTHGHSDHTGSLDELLKHWDVPVYAHPLEIPFLTGQSAYPPPDPTVGHGLMSLLSVLFSRKPVTLPEERIMPINVEDGLAEVLPEWKFIHTPGHTPGHLSLFWPLNTTLIAGDAISTTRSESAIAVLGDVKRISGPPMYMTPDWQAAEESVKKLTDLHPRILAAGHGPLMRSKELKEALEKLVTNFKEIAVPSSGRYIDHPIQADENGVQYVPPFSTSTQFKVAAVIVGAIGGFLLTRKLRR